MAANFARADQLVTGRQRLDVAAHPVPTPLLHLLHLRGGVGQDHPLVGGFPSELLDVGGELGIQVVE
jgi:hypothetical protein